MAIDSAEKRRNIAALWTGFTAVGVTPDALKGAAWRQEAGWGYMGIPAAGPAPPPVTSGITGVTVPRGLSTNRLGELHGLWWGDLEVSKPFKF